MRKLSVTICLLGILAVRVDAQPTLGGFVELVQAVRIDENFLLGDHGFGDRTYPRSEAGAQLTFSGSESRSAYFTRLDVTSDGSGHERDAFAIELREARIGFNPSQALDFKVGRQVVTWGTGDLVFANDHFPKDWEAFFTGLDDSYLKASHDLGRISLRSSGASLDLILTPYSAPDKLPHSGRMTMFDPVDARTANGRVLAIRMRDHPKTLRHGEIAARLGARAAGAEWALYGYVGHWSTPQRISGDFLLYPTLQSVGASVQSNIGTTLVHGEFALYHSSEDPDGDDPLIVNSQIRGFIGLEKSLGHDWTVGSQYYAEWMMDYDEYLAGVPTGAPLFDEVRSTATLRLTRLARHETVKLSVFGFWGITDEDWHLRPSLEYSVTDAVKWTLGASLLDGNKPYTTFGQFRGNSNVFTRLRYSF